MMSDFPKDSVDGTKQRLAVCYKQWRGAKKGAMMTRFQVGDRVKVSVEPHGMEPGETKEMVGTVRIAEMTDVYGILFDGDADVHKWYVGDELISESGENLAPMAGGMFDSVFPVAMKKEDDSY